MKLKTFLFIIGILITLPMLARATIPDRHVLWLTTPTNTGRLRPPIRMSIHDSRNQCEQELRQQMTEVLSMKRAEKIRADAGPKPRAATVDLPEGGWLRFEFGCLPVGVNP